MTSPAAADVVWVDVLPSLDKLMPQLVKGLRGVGVQAGRQTGQEYSQGFAQAAVSGVEKASAQLAAARKKSETASTQLSAALKREADAAGALRVANARLQELMDSGKAKSSQLAAATESVNKAQRAQADYAQAAARAQSQVAQQGDAVSLATRRVAEAQDQASKAARGAGDGMAHVERQGSLLATSMGGVKTAVAGVAAGFYAVQGVGNLLSGAISAASDLSETVNKSNTIFGASAATVDAWSKTSARSVGLSRQAALDAAAGFGNMFTQLGFTSEAAAGLSTSTVQMAADLGSFNNLPTADVADRISAAFRGEYDSLQTLIPNINAARVEQEAMAATGKTNADALTEQEKATAVLAIVQKDGAAAMGDFARTSDGLANSQKILSAEWDNAKARLGELLLGPMTSIVQWTTNTLLPTLSGAWTEITGAITAFGAAWRYNDGDITSSGLPGLFERLGYWARQTFDFMSTVVVPTLVSVAKWFGENTWAIGVLVGGYAALRLAIVAHTAAMAVQQAGGFVAWMRTVITTSQAWTAVQWLLNASVAGFPLVWIVAALVAVGAAIYVLWTRSETFRDIVTAVWRAVQDGARFMWENVLQPVFAGLMAGWNALSAGISWAWNNIIKPAWSVLETVAKVLAITLAVVVFGPILLGWKLLSEGIQLAWNYVIKPTWDALAAAGRFLWTNVLSPVFGFIGAAWNVLGTGVAWVWNTIVRPTWDALSAAANFLWRNVLSPVFGFIAAAWSGLASGMTTVYRSTIAPIFGWFGGVVDAIKTSFDTAVGFISRVWEGLRDKLMSPVRFVVDTVWNNGLRSLWNTINNLWGGDDIQPFRFAGGGVLPTGAGTGGGGGTAIRMATGGVLPGYTPGRDVHSFVSPTGGRLELSGGEAIMRPEFTRALGPANIDMLNAMARREGAAGLQRALSTGAWAQEGRMPHQHFADGGVIDLPGWLDVGLNFLPGGGAVKDIIDRINGGTGGLGAGLFGQGLVGLLKTIGGKVWDAAKGLFDGGGGDAGGPVGVNGGAGQGAGRYPTRRAGWPPARAGVLSSNTAAMVAAVRAAFPQIRSIGTLGSRPNKSDHPMGKAADFMIPGWNTPAGKGLGNQVANFLGDRSLGLGLNYLIFNDLITSGSGWRRYTHPNGATSNPTLRHLDHVHASVFHNGGLVPDNGYPNVPAWLAPDERVLTPPQDRWTERLIDAALAAERGPMKVVGSEYNGDVYLVDPAEQDRVRRRELRTALAASGLG